MTKADSPPFAIGDKLKIADELREGDLVRFERIEAGRMRVRRVGLGDLDPSLDELFRMHIGAEGPEFDPVQGPFEDIIAWERLRHLEDAAAERGSNWGRFACPLETLVIYAPGEEVPPRRTLEDLDLSDEARESLEGYLLLCSKIPPPPEPLRVLAGLRIQPGQIAEAGRDDVIETLFAPGSVIELRGVLSSSAIAEPPLCGAGIDGAILDILVQDAAYMSRVTGFPREAEFALPLDCRCLTVAFDPGATHEVTGGHQFRRPTVRLEQIE